MAGKTCVVTGATDGIGLEAAMRLGAMGARLVLVGRNPAKGDAALAWLHENVAGVSAEMHYADLSRRDEIRGLATALLATVPRIDVLLNNAGGFFARRMLTDDGLEHTFALNHMGYFRLTALLRTRLVASAPARIVNVASEAHRGATLDFADLQTTRGYNGWKAYKRSKLANILFTRALARRLAGTGVTANCLHPGFVATSFGDNNRNWWGWAIALAKRFSAIPVERGGETPVYLASAPEVDRVSGSYFDECRESMPDPPARNDADAERLWTESERLAGFPVGI